LKGNEPKERDHGKQQQGKNSGLSSLEEKGRGAKRAFREGEKCWGGLEKPKLKVSKKRSIKQSQGKNEARGEHER